MTVTLAVRTRRRLARKGYVPVITSLCTDSSPAKGTIWFDQDRQNDQPLCVTEVRCGHVICEDRTCPDDGYTVIQTALFIERVASGRYILIGIKPLPASYIVT